MILHLAIGAALLAAGIGIGRWNPGPRLLSWAEDATSPGWRAWKFWPAAPVIIVALAWIWTVHPRRTLANVRSWRQAPQRGPAMTFHARHIPEEILCVGCGEPQDNGTVHGYGGGYGGCV